MGSPNERDRAIRDQEWVRSLVDGRLLHLLALHLAAPIRSTNTIAAEGRPSDVPNYFDADLTIRRGFRTYVRWTI